MSPINRGPGPLLGMRMTVPGMRPPPPLLSRFGARLRPSGMPPMRMLPPTGRIFPPMRQRMPPPPSPHPPLMQQRIPSPMQKRMPPPSMQQRMPPPSMQQRMPPPPPMQQRMPPPPMQQRMPPSPMQQRMPPPLIRQRMPPPRPGTIMRPGGPLPLFGPRIGFGPPLIMGPRGPRGPPLRPGPRGMLPHMFMRPRFLQGNNTLKNKGIIVKKGNKLEITLKKSSVLLSELDLKKPWMTDAIRTEIQRKNKLYTKARKSKDATEWENFKDLRNKVTRMIRDAKNEYLEKYPENKALVENSVDDAQEIIMDEEENILKTQDDEIIIEESENIETHQESINEQEHIKCQETVQLVAAQN
ncbi:uncharacterized protein LOC127291372 isoform X2 [Leptopilina boulardi]|uniref:uncharacterized protein LOC127291372 isoform X2 n=1 Tax=Leptopilina boulardi TaxID=63433 RepID=UPI0021F5E413|nr:uncharacterized protein LOC127291372 isoform X2 [Leptopilina boulardi]